MIRTRQSVRSCQKRNSVSMRNLEQTSSELTGKVEQAKSDLNTGRQELKDAKDTLNKRMDSIAGGKTSDAEILDARVDADGNTHENLGAHIRSGFESARTDQEEAVNHIGRMAAVSDAMRTANMVHTVDFSASNTSGDVKATAVSLGHGDRAGVIINGALKEGENDVSVLRFTEPMAFKAGTPYTVFIDETTPKVGYGIYFSEVGTGKLSAGWRYQPRLYAGQHEDCNGCVRQRRYVPCRHLFDQL